MFPIALFVVAYFTLYAFALSIPASLRPSQSILRETLQLAKTNLGPQSSLDSWIDGQEKIALDKLLDNIAPGGRNAQNAVPGTVIASPSKEHPNYYYQWVRDAAITMHTLVTLYAEHPSSYLSSRLMPIIESYATLSTKIQHTDNPSGTFSDLSSLGEPKFMVDGSAYTENWGRPQRDGPPLRAITLMSYLRAFNQSHPTLWTSLGGQDRFADLYDTRLPANSTIKADLEYVSHFWQKSGFDLWEEVDGMHFFTAIVQLRALREGSKLAATFQDFGASRWYHDQADQIENTLMPKFWDESKGHLIETLDSPRSGLDCGLLLGAIHGTPTTCSTNPDEASQCAFAPYSDEVLVSLLAMVKDQRNRFPINTSPTNSYDQLEGVGVGRYPEDGYNGYETIPGTGNPWFLCTSSVSEVLFRTHKHLSITGQLNVTSRGYPFWKALVLEHEVKENHVYKKGDAVFEEALTRLRDVGDSFLAVVRTHTDAEGRFSEQFDRVTGFMRGAEDLTWSYGAFLEAIRARKSVV